ncbi:DUF3291 domain-containing protein [Emticicia sp. CRIBPO]|uniref:DUF3291 domain-containing protein n=1 Tax=Emticicia sp. CRIBPO TaxID=2683258 RepID=UPI00141314BB|nr:DUF3291 domain-containing protein [Emticicia sp. CRIBPO]NBA88864.1 DUF3291 domain-containing protein [Emticicia sp. CRIBPO]
MYVSLTIAKYSGIRSPMGFLSMALFRLFLYPDSRVLFYKLLGTGKNGTFDMKPDFFSWGLLATWKNKEDFDDFLRTSFIGKYWKLFSSENWTILCQPLQSHGQWDGKKPFHSTSEQVSCEGPVAVLTRATIRVSKLRAFWSNVGAVAEEMKRAEGFISSVGIGEVPFLKQATFSIWENQESIDAFAYKKHAHRQVIKRTRAGQWYSEELFARFVPVATYGTFPGSKLSFQFSNNEVLNN